MVDIGWLFEELSRVLNAELSFLMGAMRWGFIALAMIFAATFALRGSQRLGDYFRDWVQWLLFGGAALFLIVAAVITVLSASDGATSFGNSTNVNTTVAYELDEYQWDDLKDVSREIASANSYDEALDIARSYGLVDDDLRLDSNMSKKVRLASGIETSVQIIGIYQDDLGNGGKAGLTFAFVDAIAEHAMNSDESTNSGGWEDSDMRRWLNGDFIEHLPFGTFELIAHHDADRSFHFGIDVEFYIERALEQAVGSSTGLTFGVEEVSTFVVLENETTVFLAVERPAVVLAISNIGIAPIEYMHAETVFFTKFGG